MLIALLLAVFNFVLGCCLMIRLGYGPPNWQTALNLIIRLTTLQDFLNAVRDWLEQKAPWADRLFERLHVPKPIVIIDTTPEEDEEEEEVEEEEYIAEEPDESSEESPETQNEETQRSAVSEPENVDATLSAVQ